MVITDHFVDLNDNAWFTVSNPEYDFSENILAEQMLSIDPTQIELYQYLNAITPPTTASYDPIQEHLQAMIISYFDVEHYSVALDLVDTCLVARRRPSTSILQAMVRFMLQPKTRNQYKSTWLVVDKAHSLLHTILARCGPSVFDHVWTSFGTGDDGLGAFDDFWAFVAYCLQPHPVVLHAKACLAVLDLLITLLEQDVRGKKDHAMNKAILLTTLQKSIMGGWDRFDRCVGILVVPFETTGVGVEQKQTAARLFQLIIALGYAGIVSLSCLADQTYHRALNCLPHLAQYLQTHAFLLQVCDRGFLDANWTDVPPQYQSLRNTTHETPTHWLEKWGSVYLNLRPSMCWRTLYLHVWMIKQYYHSILAIASLRYGTHLIRDPATLLDEPLTHWLDQVEQWQHQCPPDPSWQQQVTGLLDTLLI